MKVNLMLNLVAGNDTAKVMIVRATMASKLSKAGRKILFPLFLSSWMVSCSPLQPFGWAQDYLDIAKLEGISNQRVVNVQGIVVNVAPFLEGGAYQIQDKTGRVWVKTDRQLPKKGTVLSIRGEVAFEAIFVGPEKLGESYLVEVTSPDSPTAAGSENSAVTTETTAAVKVPENSNKVEVIETETPGNGSEEMVEESKVDSPNSSTGVAEGVEETTAPPPSSAANLMPPTQVASPENQPTSIPVANPEAPRPIADSATPPPAKPTRPNLDDQFLPHKRLAK